MQRSLPVLIALVLLFSTVGWSADLEKGKEAYEKEDYETALRELKPLAEKGHAAAQYYLGRIYHNGYGVPQNYRTAVKWYRLAAEKGYISAQYLLGIMYEEGKGVPRDNVYAHMWYNVCASQGSGYGVHNREVIQGKMTPSEIEKAQDLSDECVEKKYKGCGRPKR